MLKRRAEFHGEAAVGYENKANHEELRRARVFAPHERALILTIQNPLARGVWRGSTADVALR
jgi:hypothetical protein